MYNELIFAVHIFFAMATTLIALRFGKEALVALACTHGILSNLLIAKQITLFGFDVTACDIFAVSLILSLNLIQEHYGQEEARKTIGINFFILIGYVIFSQIHLLYTPNHFDTMQPHYLAILSLMPRISIVSIIVYVLSQYLDSMIFGALKTWCSAWSLTLRSSLSLSISQLVDTVLFSLGALYGVVGDIADVIIVSYAVKMIVILCASPFVALSSKVLKNNRQ